MWDFKSELFLMRKALGLTQREVGARMFVHQKTVSMIERHGPENVMVDMLAHYVAALGGRMYLEIELPGAEKVRWEMT